MSRLIESVSRPLQVKNAKTLSGLFAVTDTFNQNGRRYPEPVYREAYEELIPKIKERRLLGELDHPLDRDEVFLSNVSHVITECHVGTSKSGHQAYYGTVELLDTPAGRIAQALVKAGIPIGISSRGVGNTKQVSEGVEVTQLKLITYDLVAEPSFSSAILSEDTKSELSESLQSIESKLPLNESSREHDSIRESINNIRKSLKLTEPRVHIDKCSVQTMELDALKSVLESKMKIINTDTQQLVECRQQKLRDSKKISELESELRKMRSRDTSLRGNHQKLQEAFNDLKESYQSEMKKKLSEKDEQILELRKRLAVEQRGMSYSKVCDLLEGVSSDEEINSRLDSISNMSNRSQKLTEDYKESVKESLMSNPPEARRPLSRIISRV